MAFFYAAQMTHEQRENLNTMKITDHIVHKHMNYDHGTLCKHAHYSGSIKWPNGDRYEGEFLFGKFHG